MHGKKSEKLELEGQEEKVIGVKNEPINWDFGDHIRIGKNEYYLCKVAEEGQWSIRNKFFVITNKSNVVYTWELLNDMGVLQYSCWRSLTLILTQYVGIEVLGFFVNSINVPMCDSRQHFSHIQLRKLSFSTMRHKILFSPTFAVIRKQMLQLFWNINFNERKWRFITWMVKHITKTRYKNAKN